MASKDSQRRLPPPPEWMWQLHHLERLFLDLDSYDESVWAGWEKRIQQGHEAEEKAIQRWHDRMMQQESPLGDHFNPSEIAGEDYQETCRLTSSMHAAVTVALWSDIEYFLRRIVQVAYRAAGQRDLVLRQMRDFCDDVLAKKRTNIEPNKCAKDVMRVFAERYKFEELKRALHEAAGVALDKCNEYRTINAIRILNNAFKHNRGMYKPAPDAPHSQIDEELLSRWSLVQGNDRIDYSQLSIRELVCACDVFCKDVIGKVRAAIVKYEA